MVRQICTINSYLNFILNVEFFCNYFWGRNLLSLTLYFSQMETCEKITKVFLSFHK